MRAIFPRAGNWRTPRSPTALFSNKIKPNTMVERNGPNVWVVGLEQRDGICSTAGENGAESFRQFRAKIKCENGMESCGIEMATILSKKIT